MSVVVRPAVQSDIPWILIQLRTFSHMYRSNSPLFGEDDAYNQGLLIKLMTEHVFLVAEVDGVLAGLISGYVWNHHFNPKIRLLSEQFWFVSEEYRGTSAGARLLSAFEDKKSEVGANWITFSLLADSPIKRETLERRGYHMTESSFLRES